jgi:hypothetical protein
LAMSGSLLLVGGGAVRESSVFSGMAFVLIRLQVYLGAPSSE